MKKPTTPKPTDWIIWTLYDIEAEFLSLNDCKTFLGAPSFQRIKHFGYKYNDGREFYITRREDVPSHIQ